jgi:formate dehydrogenase subunit delta
MHIETLIRMANDIGAFFASEPEADQAANGVLTHIKRFWDPRMRSQLIAHYRSGGEGLAPHVKAAVAKLAAESSPAESKV